MSAPPSSASRARGRALDLRDLTVYQDALQGATRIFRLSRTFPNDERFAMTDQIRRCSRSVCVNIAEAWRKRRYPQHFGLKLTDAQAEASEAQVWLELAVRSGYVNEAEVAGLSRLYDTILARLQVMASSPASWMPRSTTRKSAHPSTPHPPPPPRVDEPE